MEESATPLRSVTITGYRNQIVDFFKVYATYILLGIFAVNILILDVVAFGKQKNTPIASLSQNLSSFSSTPDLSCPQSCINQMQAIAGKPSNSTPTVTSAPPPPGSTATPTFTPTPSPSPAPSQSFVKEYFVPMGSGSGNAADWTTVPGLEVTLDPADFGKITRVYLEVTLRIPTGNESVSVRLHNASNFQDVSGSEMSLSNGTPTLLTSSPLTLFGGKNTYQIQMKTQLQYPAYVDQARLRINVQ